jgi:7-cyano-7-deazaguanine synthase
MVVLLSGGLDSTVLLAHVVDKYAKLEAHAALSINYGQLHKKELECAVWQAEHFGVPWKLIDIQSAYAGIENPLFGDGTIPEGSYAEQLKQGAIRTYVPNRNMIMLSIAAAHAIAGNHTGVAYAAHMDDAAGNAYPDCTPEFLGAMKWAMNEVCLGVYAPFIDNRLTKKDIVKMGIKLKVDFSHTWSCYKGGNKPCGVCGTCIDRKAALEANGLTDDTY